MDACLLLMCARSSVSVLSQEIGWEERVQLQNDLGLFCVEWNVKRELNQSINQSFVPIVQSWLPACYFAPYDTSGFHALKVGSDYL